MAVAESLTGGLVTAAFTDVAGASLVLRGGVGAYATDVKARVRGRGGVRVARAGSGQGEGGVPVGGPVGGPALGAANVLARGGVEGVGAWPRVVGLGTYARPLGHTLAIAAHDVRNTRISWQDRSDHRVDLAGAPAQDHWYDGVASFLLNLSAGSLGCATHSSPSSR